MSRTLCNIVAYAAIISMHVEPPRHLKTPPKTPFKIAPHRMEAFDEFFEAGDWGAVARNGTISVFERSLKDPDLVYQFDFFDATADSVAWKKSVCTVTEFKKRVRTILKTGGVNVSECLVFDPRDDVKTVLQRVQQCDPIGPLLELRKFYFYNMVKTQLVFQGDEGDGFPPPRRTLPDDFSLSYLIL